MVSNLCVSFVQGAQVELSSVSVVIFAVSIVPLLHLLLSVKFPLHPS